MQTRLLGDASFPGRGRLTVSWPLGAVVSHAEGICPGFRYDLLLCLLVKLIEPKARAGGACPFSAAWEEISLVEVAPRSFAVHLNGRRGCRFVVLRRHKLDPIFGSSN